MLGSIVINNVHQNFERKEAELEQIQQQQEQLLEEKETLKKENENLEKQLQAKAEVKKTVRVASVKKISPTVNENITWDFLIAQGFTRNQTAGIMGNLRQEHNFQTSGDGLAQWNGGRRARLMAMNNPYSIETQLQFMMIELNGSYKKVKNRIIATDNVVEATRIFQNQFERCGVCNEPARIRYAKEILARH